MQQAQFVIMYGPPGAGKSRVYKARYEGLNYVIIDVDSIIEKRKDYQGEIETVKRLIAAKSPRARIEEESARVYRKHRASADIESEELLHRSISERRNVIFETTGGSDSSVKYLEKKIELAKKSGYNIHIIFPMCEREENIRRATLRGLEDGRVISLEVLNSLYISSYANFLHVMDLCDEVEIIKTSSA